MRLYFNLEIKNVQVNKLFGVVIILACIFIFNSTWNFKLINVKIYMLIKIKIKKN